MISKEAIIERQLRRWEMEKTTLASGAGGGAPREVRQPVITVSRQHASGGSAIASLLAERFGYTLLYRDVIERLCESTGYKRRIIESLDEHARSQLQIWFEAMFAGKYVDSSDYVKGLLQVIYGIAQLGGVVVVGRGANFVVGAERGFHVRVIAPRELRIRSAMQQKGLSEKDATREVDASDHERAEFIRKVFRRSIDDPHCYDLVLNTHTIPVEGAADLIVAAARAKFERLRSCAG